MQKFSVTILGSNSALPANGRYPTAQLLNVDSSYYLIDCGEGTQMQLRRYRLKMQRITAIFISHLHGDHYFGLLGLINSLHLLGRKQELTLVCPCLLKKIIELQLKASGGALQYKLNYIFTDSIHQKKEKQELYADKHIVVNGFPLKHRIDCSGFEFAETKSDFKYDPEKGGALGVKVAEIPRLKKGVDIERLDGTFISHLDVTSPPDPIRKYAYCTDTKALESTSVYSQGADTMYHEATFLKSEARRAKQTYHSTAERAAGVALKANVGQLLIGHFSARYKDLEPLLTEASEVFPNTALAIEGTEFEIIKRKQPYQD